MLSNLVPVITGVIINPLITLLFVLALAYFFWGVFEFISKPAGDSEKETGKKHMIWGVVGMFIMASVKGIISLIKVTIGV